MNMRLDKFLAEMGAGTRSQVKEMIRRGRVEVDGRKASKPEEKIDPQQASVCLDGRPVAYAAFEYYMLNKPQGVVSATEDKRYPAATDLIASALRRDLFPVGRLDLDTEGLLLLTNDGALAHDLLSPRKHVDKVYYARIQGSLPSDAAQRAEQGLVLEDGTKTMPALLQVLSPEEIRLTIREGKFHQVKRMVQVLGCKVVYLKRLSMGPLNLDPSLEPGQYRPLTQEEVAMLKNR